MSVEEFDNGYWYATEVKAFAKSLGFRGFSSLRKDELEDLIRNFLHTGKLEDGPRRPRPATEKDSELGITRGLRVVNYTNDRDTKDFLEEERTRLSPGQPQKSGARYRLNRWREEQISAGRRITYGDLAKQYVALSDVEGPFAQARSGRYINFRSNFLKNEDSATKADAIAAWHQLKKMDVPKTYEAWKKRAGRH